MNYLNSMFKTYFTKINKQNNNISDYSCDEINKLIAEDFGKIEVYPSPRRNPFNEPLQDIKSNILEITQEIEANNQDTLVELEHQGESIKRSLNLTNINNYVLDTSSQVVNRIQSVTVNMMKYFTPSYYLAKKDKNTEENSTKDENSNKDNKLKGNNLYTNFNQNIGNNPEKSQEDRELENEIIVCSSEDNFLDIIYRKIKGIKNNGLQMSEILDEQDEMIDHLGDQMDKNIDKSYECIVKISEILK